MGNPFGGMSSPPPIAGKANQSKFLTSLFGSIFAPGGGFQGVPAYTGQLTPDVNNTLLPSVYNSFSSLNSELGNANPVANLQKFAGGGAPSSMPANPFASMMGGQQAPAYQPPPSYTPPAGSMQQAPPLQPQQRPPMTFNFNAPPQPQTAPPAPTYAMPTWQQQNMTGLSGANPTTFPNPWGGMSSWQSAAPGLNPINRAPSQMTFV